MVMGEERMRGELKVRLEIGEGRWVGGKRGEVGEAVRGWVRGGLSGRAE